MVMFVVVIVMIMVMFVVVMIYKSARRVCSVYDEPGNAYPPTFEVKISGMGNM